ncbi:hypothetical protein GQ53DRAFT_667454, partial [Thozetella sp. PMI_491]
MRLTAEIDRRAAGQASLGRCFGPRLSNILQAVQQFAALGDIVVGGSQNLIACGVWSLLLVNFSSHFEKLSMLFMTVGRSAPRYQSMALLYTQSKNLQSHLSEYLLVVVRLCHKLLRSTQQPMFKRVMSLISESELKSFQSDFDLWASAIKEEMELLTTQEIKKQSSRVTALFKSSQSELHRKKIKARLHILDACSTYDNQMTWKEVRKSGTTTLFTQTRKYRDWKDGNKASTLVYTGKLGSGKSVLLANMVDDLHLHPRDIHAQNSCSSVAYFFCRHDIPESLKARTILGSLARQLLCTIQCPPETFEDLAVPGRPGLDSEEILGLVRHILPPTYRAYFVLDGLDECDEHQKTYLLNHLQKLQSLFSLSICLSFRLEADHVLQQELGQLTQPSTVSIPEDNPDIAVFIRIELERRVISKKLQLGDPALILEIQDALLQRAQGMFLWVVLQIESLCLARTDEAIRQALADLPKDLPATFSRILKQSETSGKDYQQRLLHLITAAFRPLTTDELREALGVVLGDTNWNPARMPNDIYSVLNCCGSLVITDEETLTVKLIHHSLKQFLLSGQLGDVSSQTFTVEAANKTMSDVIITYLNYNVFETQLSTTVVPQVQAGAVPATIIRSTLKSSSSVQKIALRLLRASENPSNVGKILAEEGGLFNAESPSQFYFLLYAKSYWSQHIKHTLQLEPTSYKLLGRILEQNIIDKDIRDNDGRTPLSWAASGGHEAVARLLLEKGATVDAKDNDGRTPLFWAARGVHEAVARLLLEKGATVDAKDNDDWMPLLLAASGGHEAATRLLLEK